MTLIGIVLLISGIIAFMVTALTEKNLVWLSFLLLMASLLFFNLPTVLARRRERTSSDRTTDKRP